MSLLVSCHPVRYLHSCQAIVPVVSRSPTIAVASCALSVRALFVRCCRERRLTQPTTSDTKRLSP